MISSLSNSIKILKNSELHYLNRAIKKLNLIQVTKGNFITYNKFNCISGLFEIKKENSIFLHKENHNFLFNSSNYNFSFKGKNENFSNIDYKDSQDNDEYDNIGFYDNMESFEHFEDTKIVTPKKNPDMNYNNPKKKNNQQNKYLSENNKLGREINNNNNNQKNVKFTQKSNEETNEEKSEGEKDLDIAAKLKTLYNKLNNFINNFYSHKYDMVFSNYLKIERNLISMDLIKNFKDDLEKNKELLKDLSLDLFEFYPKGKTYKKYADDLEMIPSRKHGKFIIIDKMLDKREYYKEVIDHEAFALNYIFFEPLSQYIKSNIGNHLKSIEISKKVLNFSKPELFFPLARQIKRKFIYHMGPTNSGKTSNALKRLAEASTGIYLAPLRLLAWEIHEKLKNQGISCTLLTGQDRVYSDNATHFSMTIEKMDPRKKYDIAVIDEIQMIEDDERGNAWTNAVLGVNAEEIHLCGDERGLGLLAEICKITGDELFCKKYTRFSNLVVEEEVFRYSNIKPGDCIISFAKTKIMEIRNRILENSHQNPDCCAVIYGDLPSDTKKDQAKMFNETTFSPLHGSDVKFDYLVASDAIGMGLNLKINRIIFSTVSKKKNNHISPSMIKQIAGRAGRSNSTGYVTAFHEKDLQYIKSCLGDSVSKGLVPTDFNEPPIKVDENYSLSENEKLIKRACLFPQISDVLEIANKLNLEWKAQLEKKVTLYDVFMQFDLFSGSNNLYFIRDLKKILKISFALKEIDSTLEHHYNFVIAPCKSKEFCVDYLKRFFIEFNNGKGFVNVPIEFTVDKRKYMNRIVSIDDIIHLQDIHNCVEVYINLSMKYRNNFIQNHKARMIKIELTHIINTILKNGNGRVKNLHHNDHDSLISSE